MNPSVYTFDGTAINDTTNYVSKLLVERGTFASQAYFEGSGDEYPRYTGKTVNPYLITLQIELKGAAPNTQYDVIAKLFQPTHTGTKQLIVKDTDDSDKQYYLDVVVKSFQRLARNIVKVSLGATEEYWTAVTKTTTNKSVTASGDKVNVTTGTNTLNTHPIIKITPTSAGSVSSKAQFVLITNTLDETIENYGYDFGEAAFDTATIVTAGNMQSDGSDLILEIDGVEQSRWIEDANTDHTKVWGLLNLSPKKVVDLSGTIASSGTITSIVAKTSIADWPDSGRFAIGTEIFIYSEKDDTTKTFTVSSRGAYESTEAAHADGDDIKWVEHEIWFKFGGDTAMTADETIRPMFDTATSTNTSHVYTSFRDDAGLRANIWNPSVITPSGSTAEYYTANHGTNADPASEMGGHATQIGRVMWTINNIIGITHMAATGIEIYGAEYISAYTGCLSFYRGTSVIANRGAGITPDTWVSVTDISSTSLGGTYQSIYLLIGFSNTGGQLIDNYAEVSAVTITLDSTRLPSNDLVTVRDIYALNATISNNTRTETFTIAKALLLNETMQIDCRTSQVTYSGDSEYHYSAITNKNTLRTRILTLTGGATNEIEYTQTGTGNVTLSIEHYDRKPL